jgi:SsrA-binding protein
MTIVENRKARYDYFVQDQFEAGLMLHGWEVKSIRQHRVSLQEAYVVIRDGTLSLIGAHITPSANITSDTVTDPVRSRTLLLRKSEIEKLIDKVKQGGFTIVPLNLHFKGGLVKLEMGLAKGKKQHDKRNTEKERDATREIQQNLRKMNND